jgi:hypothetical protein
VIGLRRNEVTHQPETYYERLADHMGERTAILIDPMLATGGSALAAIDMLKAAGCRQVKCLFLVAAPEGLRALEAAHPDIEVYVASVDERLNEDAYILPCPAWAMPATGCSARRSIDLQAIVEQERGLRREYPANSKPAVAARLPPPR